MPKWRETLLLVPAALLATGALVAGLSHAGPTLVWVPAAAAAGTLLGLGCAALVVRGRVRALGAVTASLAADADTVLPEAGGFGPLAPLARRLDELAQALRDAREAATTDRLTHVANRPTLLAALFAEVERAARHSRPLAIAFIDLDHFKAINDSYGHEVGDTVLRGVADVFCEHIRGSDILGRYGGEEFVLVLPETTIEDAAAVAEKLRLLVLKARFGAGNDGEAIGVSISIGVAGGLGQHLRVDQLLRDADAAMYSAKSLGRNQTYVFAETDDDAARIPRSPISPEGRARAAEVGDLARQAAESALSAVLSPLPHYGGRPSSLIAAIAVRLATELGLPPAEVERIRVAALLHDIGKLAVPDQILDKPAPLTAEEWQSVVQHPRIGQAIIERVTALGDAGAIILHHHEQFSGHGYPHGLRGTDIPLGARIVAIADAYDAMVRDRPYRAAIGHEAAVAELRRYSQVQFDPELVERFCDLYGACPPRPDPALLIASPVVMGGRARAPRGEAASA